VGAVALLLAAALGPLAPPPAIDFGAVELGRAGVRTLAVSADAARATGAGFSATAFTRGVLVVFEPYDLDDVDGELLLQMPTGPVRVALHGRGVDTIAPRVALEAITTRGRTVTVRFSASDNDLVAACVLSAGGRELARSGWPSSTLRARVPGSARAPRITVTAVDRAGNRAAATAAVRLGRR
jgi:hypothetical protein